MDHGYDWNPSPRLTLGCRRIRDAVSFEPTADRLGGYAIEGALIMCAGVQDSAEQIVYRNVFLQPDTLQFAPP
jgi:hypothetical protein